jgi:G:T-mismatch repair DNA endonuclease (very short patch repair protein)
VNIIKKDELISVLKNVCLDENNNFKSRKIEHLVISYIESINFYISDYKKYPTTKKKIEMLLFPKICLFCGCEFISPKSTLCSKECYSSYLSKQRCLNPSGFTDPNFAMNKFGVQNVSQLQNIKDKKKITRAIDKEIKDKSVYKKRIKSNNEKRNGSWFSKEKFNKTCLEKYGVENPIHQYGWSKTSQKLFNEISVTLDNNILEKTYYATKNKEFNIRTKTNFYLFDFVISSLKKCIEYNGDKFHANPLIYNEFDTPNPYNKLLTAKEIWNNDYNKNESLKKLGFDVLIIWEHDYKINPEKELQKCLTFING